MRRLITLTITMLALTGFMAITALAQSPHYLHGTPTTNGIDKNGDLQVNFTIAGLGNNVTIDMTVTADTTTTFLCQNKGGNCPNAANKLTVSGPETVHGLFTSGKNGSLSGALTLQPGSPGDFKCPGGQNLILGKVTYADVTITSSAALPIIHLGTFSFTAPNLGPDCLAQLP
jgi:hypothetical protein